MDDINGYVKVPNTTKADIAFFYTGGTIKGSGIDSGDIVLIKTDEEIKDGDIVALSFCDNAYLRRIYHDKSSIILTADNPEYSPLYLSEEEMDYIHIIGKAVYVIKELK